jgi:hypothetical protein
LHSGFLFLFLSFFQVLLPWLTDWPATALSVLSSSSPSVLGSCACAYEPTAVRSSLQVKYSRSWWFHSPSLGPILSQWLFQLLLLLLLFLFLNTSFVM